jgi:hypothetical protein
MARCKTAAEGKRSDVVKQQVDAFPEFPGQSAYVAAWAAAPSALKPLAYSVKQVLDLVPISRAQLYVEIAAGKLIPTKIGARTLFTPQALEAWLAGGAER